MVGRCIVSAIQSRWRFQTTWLNVNKTKRVIFDIYLDLTYKYSNTDQLSLSGDAHPYIQVDGDANPPEVQKEREVQNKKKNRRYWTDGISRNFQQNVFQLFLGIRSCSFSLRLYWGRRIIPLCKSWFVYNRKHFIAVNSRQIWLVVSFSFLIKNCRGAYLLKPTQKGSLLRGNYFYSPNITLEKRDNYNYFNKDHMSQNTCVFVFIRYSQ
jgi:hypothetical protein